LYISVDCLINDLIIMVVCNLLVTSVSVPAGKRNLRDCHKDLDYPATAAMMLEADDSSVAEWLDVEPSVINYRFRKNGEVFVNLSNLTTQTVTIAPRTVLCELQPVTIEDDVFKKNEEQQKREQVLADLNIDEDQILTDEQRQELRDLMQTKNKDNGR